MSKTPTDWLQQLQRFSDEHPELPAGDDIVAEAEPTDESLPHLHVSISKKGRAGKTAILIEGFSDPEQADSTARMLRRALATGGSSRGCEVLIQGDCRNEVIAQLRKSGFTTNS